MDFIVIKKVLDIAKYNEKIFLRVRDLFHKKIANQYTPMSQNHCFLFILTTFVTIFRKVAWVHGLIFLYVALYAISQKINKKKQNLSNSF